MKSLWAPWRLAYVKGKRDGQQPEACIFCQFAAQPEADSDNFVIARSTHIYAALNRYPYTYGHIMLMPYAHLATPADMPPPALTDLMLMTNQAMAALRAVANPPAFNIGANIGAAAGASIAAHFHFHIVPRWPGDHSFMECIGGARSARYPAEYRRAAASELGRPGQPLSRLRRLAFRVGFRFAFFRGRWRQGQDFLCRRQI